MWCMHAAAHGWRSEEDFEEAAQFFHHVAPRIELRLPELGVSASTC